MGESVLYPTNLLPSDRLQWLEINAERALLTFTYNGLNLHFTITFNKTGEITELETKRYMDTNRLETWIIKASDYRLRNQVKVPNSFDVIWRLSKGDFSYARFNITDVEYDVAARF
ncbi:hypothetical protein MKP07_33750 [Niabella hibiscisoli]|nr:hypothetical protein [Niabella hibiscisoli]